MLLTSVHAHVPDEAPVNVQPRIQHQPILGLLGQVIGYQTVGDIIVGSATSSVSN